MGKNKNRNRKPTKQKSENLPKEITPVVKAIDDKAQIKQEEKSIKKDPANYNDPKNLKNTAPEDLKQPQVQGKNDASQIKNDSKGKTEKNPDATDTKNISTKNKPDAKGSTNTAKNTEAAEKTDCAKKADHSETADSEKTKADPPDPKSTPANKPNETKTKDDFVSKETDSAQQKTPGDKQTLESVETKSQDATKAPAPTPTKSSETENGTVPTTDTIENGSEKGRVFDSRILNHDQFMSPQKWYIDVKTDSIAPSYCTNCDATINLGDIHLYSYGLLLLPSLDKVVKTKLRFCTTSKCIKNIKGSNHNIRDIPDEMKVIQGPSVIMTEEEEEALKDQSFIIVKSWHMGLSELQPFKFEENTNDQPNTNNKPNDPDDTKSSTPDEPHPPIKVPEISYDGTDAETTAALREELKNTLNRGPIKATTTPIKDTVTTTKDTRNATNNVKEKGSTENGSTETTKSGKKSRKSSKPSKTVKSSKTPSTDKVDTSTDNKQGQKETPTAEKTIEAADSVGQSGTGNGVRKEDPLDAAQTSQASCNMM